MSSNTKKIIWTLIGIVFWLSVWEAAALIVNVRFIFPSVIDVIIALYENAFGAGAFEDFWASILFSLLRVLIGLLMGVVFGIAFAVLTHFLPQSYYFINPLVTVLRCTPVASFIMIFWLLISDFFVPSIIACIIVFPIVWQSAYESLSTPDKNLSEVADIFRFGPAKRFFTLTMPGMIKSVIPGIISASGLAWKSGIAAEIITYTKGSIGRFIANSKNELDGSGLFAWTLVVIILSILVEFTIKSLMRRSRRIWE